MHYKKLFTIVNLSIAGTAFLFLVIGASGFSFSLLFIPLTFLIVMIFVNPDLLNLVRRIAISRFGSHEENDILSHFADVFFGKVVVSNVSAQLDIKNEPQMIAFADALKHMVGGDVLPDMKKFYPEVSEQQWDVFFNSLVSAGKNAMQHVFFPGENQNPTQIVQTLKEQYPFMAENTAGRLVEWWRRLKSKMEWQNRVDGTQR
jgi:hypothetical protein